MEDKNVKRREFLGLGAAVAAGALIIGCGEKKRVVDYPFPPLLDQAPDGKPLRAGLVGCGGRGKGAAQNFLDAGPNLQITALADVFEDRLQDCWDILKKNKNVEVARENCFVGLDGYKKLVETDLDIVLIATPPYFRPEQFEAAINARKHVFMEKPVAVDPVGARSIMATAKRADSLGLNVVTGTQRRHNRDYVATFKMVAEGAIGDIVSANCYWNMQQLWYKTPQSGWSELEYMIRDWVNWTWLSGDHIVEQHVHNIDVVNWFSQSKPKECVGFGSRHRRVTGDQYDNFSVDFVYDNGMHVHSMCRQINGCDNNVSEWIVGTKGVSNAKNTIMKHDGTVIWEYEYPKNDQGESTGSPKVNPYVQEHIHLVSAIRNGSHVNEAEGTAVSTLCAIMGRISAYTGKKVTWEEMMNSDLKIGPEKLAMDSSFKYSSAVARPGSEERS